MNSEYVPTIFFLKVDHTQHTTVRVTNDTIFQNTGFDFIKTSNQSVKTQI